MATNADKSNASRKDDNLSDTSTPSDSDGENSSDEAATQKIEWLATTRAKRTTAGNRMKAILANEEPAAEDSDLELLFASDEDDAGFTDVDNDASDVQMDSSSDDEDQEAGADDLEGEKELERQAKEKKKRKAQDAIPAKFRKKVRIEQPIADSASVSSAAAPQHKPRPKKKSERLSWLPTASDMPTRASERRTTKMSKEQLHQKMVRDEIRRIKQMEMMEKKAARLEALKKPPMTQAERLAEAAMVEKRNSKSLNRWEVAEKQREEERLRKIAALNSRKLDGPVVTFWSGIQELEEGQLKHVGKMVSIEEKAPRKKRQSLAVNLAVQEPAGGKAAEASKPPSPSTPGNPETKPVDTILGASEVKPGAPEGPALDQTLPPPPPPPQPSQTTQISQPSEPPPPPPPPAVQETPPQVSQVSPERQPDTAPNQGSMAPPPAPPPPSDPKQPVPTGLAAPVLAAPMFGVQMPTMGFSAPNGKSNVLAAPNTSPRPSQPSTTQPVSDTNLLAVTKPALNVPTFTSPTRPIPPPISTNTPLQPTQGKAVLKGPDTPQQATPTEPPREGKVTRSCIILQNFDEEAIKDRQVQTQILFGRKMNKLAKPAHAPICVITNHPARYRDPKTGLPFSSTYAFREIQRALRGDYKFSSLVGTYMGSGKYAARGVPERFLDPSKPRSTPVAKPAPEVTDEEKEKLVVKQEDAGEAPKVAAVGEQKTTPPAAALPVADVHPVMESRLEPTLAPIPAATPAPRPAPLSAPNQSPGWPSGPVNSPSSASGPVFAPPIPGPLQAQAQARLQSSVSGIPSAPRTGPPATYHPVRAPVQIHRPVSGPGPVFAPMALGQSQSPARPQGQPSGPVFAPMALGQLHNPTRSQGFISGHVAPPALPGSAEEAIASVRGVRVSTPPVSQAQTETT